jgi:hypothetical protein
MARKSVERRSADLRAPLPKTYKGPGESGGQAAKGPVRLLDPDTGFYTRAALAAFIQYEIDGSAQTMRNELYVTPLCLAAVAFEGGTGTKAEGERRGLEVLGDAVRKLTRVADRVAIDEWCFLLLLRRTLAKSVLEHYAPRLVETVNESLKETEATGKLSVGISSLVEHLARDPEDMIRKAMRALEEARKKPGSFVIYDFRVMPLE